MRILVTGVCGYIGCKLVEVLKNEDYFVYGFDKQDLEQVKRNLDGFAQGDLSDESSLVNVDENIDTIIHLAGEASVDADSAKHIRDNVLSSRHLYKWAIEKNIKKIILLSTVKTAGTGSYAQSKKDSEEQLIELCKQNNCSYTILRSTPVFGKGMKGGVASWIFRYNNKLIPDVRNSNSVLPMLGLNDLCSVIKVCLESSSVLNKTYEISDGNNYKVCQIDSLAKKNIGHDKSYIYIPRILLWLAAKTGDVLIMMGLKTPFNTSRYLMLYRNLPVTESRFSDETGMVFQENFIEKLPLIIGHEKQ